MFGRQGGTRTPSRLPRLIIFLIVILQYRRQQGLRSTQRGTQQRERPALRGGQQGQGVL